MTTTEQKIANEHGAVPSDDAAISDVLSAWDRVFKSLQVRLRTNATLVASDFRLSIKAVVVVFICIFTLVGLGLVVWVTLLAGLTYGLTAIGFHWLWSFLLVLVLNISALIITKKILTSALNSVEMKTSAKLLFNADYDQSQ